MCIRDRHLGLPAGPSDDEVASRYHEMVFGGLHKIYLYGDNATGETFVQALRNRYANQQSPPIMQRVMCS